MSPVSVFSLWMMLLVFSLKCRTSAKHYPNVIFFKHEDFMTAVKLLSTDICPKDVSVVKKKTTLHTLSIGKADKLQIHFLVYQNIKSSRLGAWNICSTSSLNVWWRYNAETLLRRISVQYLPQNVHWRPISLSTIPQSSEVLCFC